MIEAPAETQAASGVVGAPQGGDRGKDEGPCGVHMREAGEDERGCEAGEDEDGSAEK